MRTFRRLLVLLAAWFAIAWTAIGDVPVRAGDPEHGLWVSGIAFDAEGTHVATFGSDGHAIVWNVAGGRPVAHRRFGREGDSVTAVEFLPRASTLIVGTGREEARSTSVWAWDFAKDDARRIARPERSSVAWIALSPDGRRMFVVARRTTQSYSMSDEHRDLVGLFDVGSPKPVREREVARDTPESFFFHGNAAVVGSGHRDRLGIRNFVDDREVKSYRLQDDTAKLDRTRFTFAAGLGSVVRHGWKEPAFVTVDVWSLETGELREFLGEGLFIMPYRVKFSPDGRTALAGMFQGELVMRDCESWRQLWSMCPGDTPRRTKSKVDKPLIQVAAGVVEKGTGAGPGGFLVQERPRTATDVCFSGDSRRVAILTADPNVFFSSGYEVEVRESRTGKVLARWAVPCNAPGVEDVTPAPAKVPE